MGKLIRPDGIKYRPGIGAEVLGIWGDRYFLEVKDDERWANAQIATRHYLPLNEALDEANEEYPL